MSYEPTKNYIALVEQFLNVEQAENSTIANDWNILVQSNTDWRIDKLAYSWLKELADTNRSLNCPLNSPILDSIS